MDTRAARWLLLLVAGLAGACSSVTSSHMLLARPDSVARMQALSQRSGVVADVLTISGEEELLVLEPAAPGTIAGRQIDAATHALQPVEALSEPFDRIALIYYTGPDKPRCNECWRVPFKSSFPKLAPPGPRERAMTCSELDVELARAEALRWFARDQGTMAYTPAQVAGRHATNAAIYAGVTVLVVALAAGGGGGGIDPFPSPPPSMAGDTLKGQVGEEPLRWSVTAADRRIVGLLELKQARSCAATPSLVPGGSDLAALGQLQAARREGEAGHASEAVQLHARTRLLDQLAPKALPEASNRACGLFHCPAAARDVVAAGGAP